MSPPSTINWSFEDACPGRTEPGDEDSFQMSQASLDWIRREFEYGDFPVHGNFVENVSTDWSLIQSHMLPIPITDGSGHAISTGSMADASRSNLFSTLSTRQTSGISSHGHAGDTANGGQNHYLQSRNSQCDAVVDDQSVDCSGFNSGRQPTTPERLQRFECKWEGCTYHDTFNRDADLMRHVKHIHVSPQSYICPVVGCRKSFNRKDNLKEHTKNHEKHREN